MLGRSPSGGAFPIGYPAMIALLIPVVGDGVRAAQIVSVIGGIGSSWLVYAIGKRIVTKPFALLAAAALSLTPIFLRLSLMTLAESIFLFWVLLGFLFFERGKSLLFGLAMGMAAITRPEALGIFAVLVLLRLRPWRRLVRMLAGFVVLYAVNVAVLSVTLDRIVPGDTRFSLVRRTDSIGRTSTSWQGREEWAEFEGREEYEKALDRGSRPNALAGAAKRFPHDIALLARHATPGAIVLAAYGAFRLPLFLLAGLAPFLLLPFFSPRSDPRYVLLYLPIVMLYAAVGAARLPRGWARTGAVVLLCISILSGLYVNRNQLVEPVSDGFQWAKRAGLEWRARLQPGDKVADRKPFFAFYAGAKYVEIPIAPYDDAIRFLTDDKVRLLVLHRDTIEPLRPALTPLLFDRAAIRGEVRFRQAEIDISSYVVYERERDADPLSKKRITPRAAGMVISPSWSPDGAKIAFRRIEPSGEGGLWIVSADGGEASRVVSLGGANLVDPLAWSPDSRRIAFAAEGGGGLDIQIYDIARGTLENLIAGGANDRSPSWSGDGNEIFFSSDRTGENEVWSMNLESSSLAQLTRGGRNTYPSPSPSGERLAWVREGDGLLIMDRATGRSMIAETPVKVTFPPAWSPDGRFIAAAAEESGGARVYLVSAADGRALVLTKTVAGTGMPSWSPDGARLAVAMNEEGDFGIWLLSGLAAYEERLLSPVPVETLARTR